MLEKAKHGSGGHSKEEDEDDALSFSCSLLPYLFAIHFEGKKMEDRS